MSLYSEYSFVPRAALVIKLSDLQLFCFDISTLQRTNTENRKQIFLEKELRGHSPNVQMHVYESGLYIPTIELPILLQEICGPILGIYKSRTESKVEIGTVAVQLPEKEYINGIFVAVYLMSFPSSTLTVSLEMEGL